MVPLHWLVLDRMPLNANGKLDRKALPALDIGQMQNQAYQAPRNELEETLARIWAEVLKVERVGVFDNFFELGAFAAGHPDRLAGAEGPATQRAATGDVRMHHGGRAGQLHRVPGPE